MNRDACVKTDVARALKEDMGPESESGDITGLLIDKQQQAHARIITRESMVLCGTEWATEVFQQVDARLGTHCTLHWLHHDGDEVSAGNVLCYIHGNTRGILCAERTALNFIQTLSACATRTQQYVNKLHGLNTILLDTRKTIPGLRVALKYAVRCGGGTNHRHGLYDAFLIKENHISASGSITEAILKARALFPAKKLEIEVETLNELHEALFAKPDVIMLDNFVHEFNDVRKVREALQMRADMGAESIPFEVSGNITEDNIREIAETGVDYISTGAITKHIQAIDLTLLLFK